MRRARVLPRLALLAAAAVLAACGGGTSTPISSATPSPVPTATSASPSPSPSLAPTPTSTVVPTPTPSAPPAPPTPPPPTAQPTAAPTPEPAYELPASLRGVEWSRLPTDRKIVALTFDAGANADGLASILATLDRESVPATFFLTGTWIESYPAGARAIAAVPEHSIGNHSYDHPYMTALSDAAARDEIAAAERLIEAKTDRDPRPLFRFPYGDTNAHAVAVANSMGYGSIRWTVDTLGWKGRSDGQTAESVTSRAVGGATPGEIVIMHVGSAPDGSTLDADALPGVITGLRAKGYTFVAIWDFIYGLA